jgi:hypothetical protein
MFEKGKKRKERKKEKRKKKKKKREGLHKPVNCATAPCVFYGPQYSVFLRTDTGTRYTRLV